MKMKTYFKPIWDRYLGNKQDRTALFNVASLVINAWIGIGKLVLGIYLLSGWFITNAVYYLILCIAKGQVLHQYKVAKGTASPQERYSLELAVYKRGGLFLCFLGVSYSIVCLRMYLIGDAFIYSGLIVYIVAIVAFTKLAFAVYGTWANRHLHNPIISTLKMINFTDAMVSIVVTQATLLTMQASPLALKTSSLFGMGCSVFFCLMGVRMMSHKKKDSSMEQGSASNEQ
ncbi:MULTISPECIES: hypothetical protein [unclassified Paenibacillus]|uniref:hypothetical protein n=1 Tax=unclassified Paenibacillus TaxID=185978 RepID=UPI000CFCAEDE|nr:MULTISPECIES: hypothetical protein [unclassified Paenibacillus]MBD8837439.1 hypothetical protein [Paenibacillus sp. CFBP 13594]PRA07332.1 hypothetical protein CQ043_08005 [Paenibacillus sp. MYb63]PRA50976.1 hypothetical protein CQ061_01160 [Paenibacillus sp. MYb67]QZN74109.1 hypothetical protein K5K90_22135 [Paenibacillus sp. DR312]